MQKHAAWLLLSLTLGTLAAACSERVEEPPPVKKEGTNAAAPSVKKRCIHPTEAEPKRAVAQPSPDPKCPVEEGPSPKSLPAGKVVFPEAKDTTVTVEIARTNETRMRGLMYRKSLPEDQGMIFVFDTPGKHKFWMRNTCIPLDMLFVDDEGFVVGIEENTTTMSDTTFSVPCASTYVVEVNAGFCRRHGIRAGQKIVLSGI